MWLYEQLTGQTSHVGDDGSRDYVAKGYSGRDAGKNNPDMQEVHDLGPIPCGDYDIGPPLYHPKLGHFVMALTPWPQNDMFGRSGFFLHGDNPLHPGASSDGCPVEDLGVRERIWESCDTHWRVVSGRTQGGASA